MVITLIYPYYENPNMFRFQQKNWAMLRHLGFGFKVIVVDDGSPKNPAIDHLISYDSDFDLSIYRIGVDVRWNWIAARNIGAHHAEDGSWLLLTDMDHVVDQDLLRCLQAHEWDPKEFYSFTRVNGPNKIPNPKPHPNSWFMTKEFYWKVGGYDEAYSGNYGTDGIWRRRCEAVGKRRTITTPLIQYLPEHISDACTNGLVRKEPDNAHHDRVKAITESRAGLPPITLSFPYEQVR